MIAEAPSRVKARGEGIKDGSRLEDDRLIDAALNGDSDAFGELFCKYQNRLFNALTHFTGNATEADDVAQEAFIQAHLKLDKFEHQSNFYTWLYRIAFNTAVSRQRRKKITTSVDNTREQTGDDPIDHNCGAPDARMLQAENVKLIRMVLAKLSPDHHDILVLREMNDLEYEDIADTLGINVGTVRSRLHRARLEFRTQCIEMGIWEGNYDEDDSELLRDIEPTKLEDESPKNRTVPRPQHVDATNKVGYTGGYSSGYVTGTAGWQMQEVG